MKTNNIPNIVKIDKHSQIVKQNNKYYYHSIMSYTGGQILIEMIERDGKLIAEQGHSCYYTNTQEKLDLLFELQSTSMCQ